MLRWFLHPTVVLQGQFMTMSWIFINHYKSAVFWVHAMPSVPYALAWVLFAEVCAFCFEARSDSMRWVLHNAMCTKMLHYELCARSGTTGDMMTYVIWWLSSFSFWGQWHRLRLLLGDQVLLVCFVDSCAVFWTTYWLICSIWLHEKFISPMDVSRHKVYLWWL